MIAVPTHVFLGRDEKRFEIKMFRNDLLLEFMFFGLSPVSAPSLGMGVPALAAMQNIPSTIFRVKFLENS